MFMACNSWKSNFAAYGMYTCEICVLFRQTEQWNSCFFKFAIAMRPH
jgi:hypothetical protein